jgi:hypothetical protein
MDIRIDTLRLRADGIGEGPAQQLASLIAQRLSGALPDIASARPAVWEGELARLDVTLHTRAGDSLDDMADGIATEVLRAISASGTAVQIGARGTSA